MLNWLCTFKAQVECHMLFWTFVEKGALAWFKLGKIRLHPCICSNDEKNTSHLFFSVISQAHYFEVWHVMFVYAWSASSDYSVVTIVILNFIFSCCFNIVRQWWICWQSHCWCNGEDRSWWYNQNWVIIFNIHDSWGPGRNEGTFTWP